MSIPLDEVRRIAALAHLDFTDEALEKIGSELSQILGYIDQLKEVETAAPGSQTAPPPLGPSLRDDEPRPSVERELVERNAPDFIHGHFVVPRVIGGES